jgi:hypothetical protein
MQCTRNRSAFFDEHHFYANASTYDFISSSTNGQDNGLGMSGIPDVMSSAGIRIGGGVCAGLLWGEYGFVQTRANNPSD